MICNEANPNCLVKSCCSEKCQSVIDLISKKQKNIDEFDYDSLFKSMIKNEWCPICGKNRFHYSKVNKLLYIIDCQYCWTRFSLGRNNLFDNHLTKWEIKNVYYNKHKINFIGTDNKLIKDIIKENKIRSVI